jgi:hypothetical protein
VKTLLSLALVVVIVGAGAKSFGSRIGDQLSHDLDYACQWLAEWIVRRVGQLMGDHRERYTQEWLAELDAMRKEVEGLLVVPILFSLSLARHGLALRYARSRARRMRATTGPVGGLATALRIKVPACAITPERIEQLKAVFAGHPGESPVLLYVGNDRGTTVLRLHAKYSVEMRNGLYAELRSVLAAEELAV